MTVREPGTRINNVTVLSNISVPVLCFLLSVFTAGVFLRDLSVGVDQQDAGGDGVGLRPGTLQ